MFLTMINRSLVRGWRKKALAMLTVALGTSLAVATLNIALDVGDKVNRELKSYGANILVTPQAENIPLEIAGYNPLSEQSYLLEAELPKLKTIFWKYNVLGFAPYLSTPGKTLTDDKIDVIGTWFQKTLIIPTGENITTGVKDVKSWWQIQGNWPDDSVGTNSALVGQALAQKFSLQPGDTLELAVNNRNYDLVVTGIIAAGGDEDKQIFVPLAWLQEITGRQGKVSRLEVNALTTPKNDLARRAEELGPDALSPEDFETWYCSAFVDSIAYQIEEVIPGAWARPIRQVAESEGSILTKIQLLMALLALAAAASSVLGISSLLGTSALERSREVGLLKALGAYDSSVIWLFLAEAGIIGIIGGTVGLAAGLGLAKFVGQNVFGTAIEIKMLTIPAAFVIAIGVALLGSLSAVRIVSRLQPARILVGSYTDG